MAGSVKAAAADRTLADGHRCGEALSKIGAKGLLEVGDLDEQIGPAGGTKGVVGGGSDRLGGEGRGEVRLDACAALADLEAEGGQVHEPDEVLDGRNSLCDDGTAIGVPDEKDWTFDSTAVSGDRIGVSGHTTKRVRSGPGIDATGLEDADGAGEARGVRESSMHQDHGWVRGTRHVELS